MLAVPKSMARSRPIASGLFLAITTSAPPGRPCTNSICATIGAGSASVAERRIVTDSGRKCRSRAAADSSESLPCTRFSVNKMPRSPRIVPGAALRGLVAPIIVRTTSHVSSGPSSTIATTGPRLMNATRSA